jgi:hypothetical protein
MRRNPLSVLRSLATVLRAAARVSVLQRRRSLPGLVASLRATPERSFCDPRLDLAVLERLLPLLPPYGAGRCVKRSLLLLDLWSRAGLVPTFHLGLRGEGADRGGHAWITTGVPGFDTHRPPDVAEAWCA